MFSSPGINPNCWCFHVFLLCVFFRPQRLHGLFNSFQWVKQCRVPLKKPQGVAPGEAKLSKVLMFTPQGPRSLAIDWENHRNQSRGWKWGAGLFKHQWTMGINGKISNQRESMGIMGKEQNQNDADITKKIAPYCQLKLATCGYNCWCPEFVAAVALNKCSPFL